MEADPNRVAWLVQTLFLDCVEDEFYFPAGIIASYAKSEILDELMLQALVVDLIVPRASLKCCALRKSFTEI